MTLKGAQALISPSLTTLYFHCTRAGTHSNVRSAQVFVTCTDISAQLSSRISPTRTVRRGKLVKYQVTVLNTLRTAALPPDLHFTVQLPAGTTYVKSKASPTTFVGVAVVNGTANTVTWMQLPMGPKARRTFKVWARVGSNATSPLAFDSWLWQDGIGSNPFCFHHAPAKSVRACFPLSPCPIEYVRVRDGD